MEWVFMMANKYPFYVILVLSAVVYELGFARKLPILKKLVIYVMLFIGCIPLTVLKAFGLPIIESMLVAALLLIIVRIRQRGSKFREGME